MRKTYEELNEIKKKYGVDFLYSWSRINSWHTSKYCYYLRYIKHEREVLSNIYSALGGNIHETLEKYYSNEISYDMMKEYFESLWLANYDIAGLRFNRSDKDKDKSIATKYKKDLLDFFENHRPIKADKLMLEEFLEVKVRDDIILQGYADLIVKKGDKYLIGDWKSSTIYSKAKQENEIGQLVIYALGLHQTGVPLENISVAWNFLKYVTVKFKQNNGKVKERSIERSKFGDSVKANVKMVMKRLGYYDTEIEKYQIKVVENNSLDVLPEDVRNEFVVTDCWVRKRVTKELVDKWVEYLRSTVDEINETIEDYKLSHDDKVFYDDEETLKKGEYFFSNLSGYTLEQNKCYNEYLKRKNGEELVSFNNGEVTLNTDTNNNDGDWLTDIISSL